MRSTFYGLNIASKGLFVSQRQIDVTSHNVANSNVDGYSRQRYITSAVPPKGALSQFVDPTRGQVGDGVQTLSLDQIRDRFLDQQYRTENAKSSYWETRSNALYYVEDVFNATDETSLNGIMSAFFNSLQELSKNSTDEAIRTNVLAEAKKLTDTFHMYHSQLTDLMAQQDTNLVAQTSSVNDMISDIAAYNDKIFKFELGGSVANDLRDQRNVVLDKLSGMMNIAYSEQSFEPPLYNIYGLELTRLNVFAGKQVGEDYSDRLLVSHDEPFYLTLEQEQGLNEIADFNEPAIPTHKVYLASGLALDQDDIEDLDGGMLKSYMDMRDGNVTENQGVPYYIAQLNTMVSSLVHEFNAIHSMGYSMPYSAVMSSSDSTSGINFFDPDGETAATITLSADILLSSFNIAASSEYVTMDSDGHLQTGNNNTMLELIKGVKERTDLDEVGSYEGFYKNFLGSLASEVAHSNNMLSGQVVLLDSIQSQRVSVMGVSVDEEMTNLIRFQHAYNSSARAITAMDEALDKLINGTGRVGL